MWLPLCDSLSAGSSPPALYRHRRRWLAPLLAALALLGPLPAAAQRPQVDVFAEPEGLPTSQVRGLAQDRLGRLWILTRGGLVVYDGVEMQPVAAVAGLESRFLTLLAQGPDGDVWALSGANPLHAARFDGQRWHSLPSEIGLAREPVVGAAVLGSGQRSRLLVATERSGLLALGTDGWRRLRDRPPNLVVSGLVRTGERIFLATSQGLCSLAGDSVRCGSAADPRLSEPLLAVSAPRPDDSSGPLWVLGRAGWVGLYRQRQDDLEILAEGLELAPSPNFPLSARVAPAVIGSDRTGGVYFGTANDAFFLDLREDSVRRLGTAEGLPAAGFTAFLCDREANVWLGGMRGLARIASRRFLSWRREHGLPETEVSALLALSPGRWLLGHNSHLTRFDGEVKEVIELGGSGEKISRVMELLEGPGGEIYLAAVELGLGRLSADGGLSWFRGPGVPRQVHSLAPDGTGGLWVGGGTDGLFRWRSAEGFRRVETERFAGHFVRRVHRARDGRLLVATNRTLWQRRAGRWSEVHEDGGGRPGEVFAFHQLAAADGGQGGLLVGTFNGLRQLVDDRLETPYLPPPLVERPVFAIVEDPAGRLWLGTDNGLAMWNGERWRQLTVRQGLSGRETNRGALAVDDRGRVWVGTDGGLSVFQPEQDLEIHQPPVVRLAGLASAGRLLDPYSDHSIPAHQRNLELKVQAISLSAEGPLQLRYRLRGFEERWQGPRPLTGSPIRYTHLPAGRYRFEVAVRRQDEPWSETITSGDLSISPPLWLRPWFVLLALGLLAGLGVTGYRAYASRRHAALHDALTGLPNRTLFMDRLEAALERSGGPAAGRFAVLFLDLDRFKNVNDSLGHLVGDRLLVAIAGRLRSTLQARDTIARLGGDEFTVLLPGISQASQAATVAERIERAFQFPFQLGGNELFAGCSIGIALDDGEYREPQEMLRDADTAMYRAKALGRGGFAFFDPAMHDRAVAYLAIETDLRRALERDELELRYQPIVELGDDPSGAAERWVGLEAMLRWRHPRRGLLAPESFLTVAEETGLIVPIGSWAIDEGCRQLAAWRRAGFEPGADFRLGINLSPRQLMQADLAERLGESLDRWGIEGEMLTLEVTEGALMQHPGSVTWQLDRCRDLGVKVSIDDFGTGHSALSHLQTFPVHTIKIDRCFIADLRPDAPGLEIVRTVVELASRLGLEVVAEGVEKRRQVELLRSLGCRRAQGFLFGGPLAPREVAERLVAVRA